VPRITAGLGGYVDHGTSVAPVLRAKVVGRDLVLVYKLGVTHKNRRTRHRIVIIVLSVNFLVVTSSAQTIHDKARTVRVRAIGVAAGAHARQQHGQQVQPFVLLEPRNASNITGVECVRDLGLRRLDQRRRGSDLDGFGDGSNLQFDVFQSGYRRQG